MRQKLYDVIQSIREERANVIDLLAILKYLLKRHISIMDPYIAEIDTILKEMELVPRIRYVAYQVLLKMFNSIQCTDYHEYPRELLIRLKAYEIGRIVHKNKYHKYNYNLLSSYTRMRLSKFPTEFTNDVLSAEEQELLDDLVKINASLRNLGDDKYYIMHIAHYLIYNMKIEHDPELNDLLLVE